MKSQTKKSNCRSPNLLIEHKDSEGNTMLNASRKFRGIVDAAKKKWIHLFRRPQDYVAFGHLIVLRRRSTRFILTYEPLENRIKVWGAIADQVQNRSDKFRDLFDRANAAYPQAKAIYDSDHNIVLIESNGGCPTHKDDVPREVNLIYDDLISLINDEILLTALRIGNARLLGIPIDLWDYE